jgi:hypothetical protein
MKVLSSIALCVMTVIGSWCVVRAQTQPPTDLLSKIVPQLPKALPSRFRFEDAHKTIDPVCKMQAFNVTLSRDTGASHTFSMMSDPEKNDTNHTNILAVTSRFEVDADGSPRAYDPQDPSGQGICKLIRDQKGHYVPSGGGRCALDSFNDGSIYVFEGATRVGDSELGDDWRILWSLIRDRKLRPFDLPGLWPFAGVENYYLFFWPDKSMTVFFNENIIPRTRLGYPCVRAPNSRYSGYFVSATTLQNENKKLVSWAGDASESTPKECGVLRNIDSEAIPYFIIPRGAIGGASIGDLVVAQIRNGADHPLVYGIAADAGPIARFGEGSIAFSQALRGKSGPIMNNRDLNKLAIDDGSVIGVLIFGGTKRLLKGMYSRQNIEKTGRAQFLRWGGSNPRTRLNACFDNTGVN